LRDRSAVWPDPPDLTESDESYPRSRPSGKEILPYATELEHKDEFRDAIVEGMKEMGLFGLTISEEYGGLGRVAAEYALVVEQIARGLMSISGVINTHSSSPT